MTTYAKKILELIEASDCHMTAEQVFDALRSTYRYDKTWRHDHLVCKYCGKLADVDLGDLTRQLEKTAGIPILSYDLKLLYVCEECKNKRKGM